MKMDLVTDESEGVRSGRDAVEELKARGRRTRCSPRSISATGVIIRGRGEAEQASSGAALLADRDAVKE